MKILFVENDPLTRRSYTRLLRSRDHDVVEVETLEQARAQLASGSFDLAVLDLELAEGNTTLGLAREIADRDIPVLFHTGTFRVELLNEASKIGLVIHKGPGSVERLLEELGSER